DMLCHVVYGQPPLTRKERAENYRFRHPLHPQTAECAVTGFLYSCTTRAHERAQTYFRGQLVTVVGPIT
ncbi:hypothetical protein O5472_26270, partial [Escherichia coli]|nr:hypothetical protein [Escherichia coli]